MPADTSSLRRTVLLVCFGNLCRSPMAEGLFRARLPEPDWQVRSAGTHAMGGAPPTAGACEAVLRLEDVDISEQRSQTLTATMLAEADFVFTMSRQQAYEAAALHPAAAGKVRLLGAFAPDPDQPREPADPFGGAADPLEVADPMGGDQDAYDACCQRLVECADAAVAWLQGGAASEDAPQPGFGLPEQPEE